MTKAFASRLLKCKNTSSLKKELEKKHASIMRQMRMVYDENNKRNEYLDLLYDMDDDALQKELDRMKRLRRVWYMGAVESELYMRNVYEPTSPAYATQRVMRGEVAHYDPTGY